MVRIEDATNVTLPFDEFKPSTQELKEVLSKCLSYYGLSLDKISTAKMMSYARMTSMKVTKRYMAFILKTDCN